METFFIPNVSMQLFFEILHNLLIINNKKRNIFCIQSFRLRNQQETFPLNPVFFEQIKSVDEPSKNACFIWPGNLKRFNLAANSKTCKNAYSTLYQSFYFLQRHQNHSHRIPGRLPKLQALAMMQTIL